MRRSTWRWLVTVVRVQRAAGRITCTGARHALRATRADAGGLRVEAAARADGRWRRVDDDLVALVRAVVRLRLAAPAALDEVVQGAVELAGVPFALVEEGGRDPVGAVVRATYPLLAVAVGGRLPSLPATLPVHLQPAFRCPTPRAAAGLLFSGRVTRPLVRAFGAAFGGLGVPDLFRVTVAAAASRRLEPDQLVALMEAGTAAPATAPRAALTALESAGIADLVDGLQPRRALRLLVEGVADTPGRERLRFVAAERAPDGPSAAEAADLEELALAVALRPPAPAVALRPPVPALRSGEGS
jgi:hypothetical protein